jgi:hypothetical protein
MDLTTFQVNDSIHLQMSIIQDMWKSSLNHSSIIAKYLVVCVLVYTNTCKIKFVSNDFNILNVNGSTLIIKEMWKNH